MCPVRDGYGTPTRSRDVDVATKPRRGLYINGSDGIQGHFHKRAISFLEVGEAERAIGDADGVALPQLNTESHGKEMHHVEE